VEPGKTRLAADTNCTASCDAAKKGGEFWRQLGIGITGDIIEVIVQIELVEILKSQLVTKCTGFAGYTL